MDTEVRISKLAVNCAGLLLASVTCPAAILLARALPHYSPFAPWHAIPFLAGALVLLPLHEALHAVGFSVFARVEWRQISLGVSWRALMPYCHCTVPMPVAAYRRMILLPLWVTGTVSLTLLLIFPSDALGAFTGVAVASCIGDIWLFAKLHRLQADVLVQDSPSEAGCEIVSS